MSVGQETYVMLYDTIGQTLWGFTSTPVSRVGRGRGPRYIFVISLTLPTTGLFSEKKTVRRLPKLLLVPFIEPPLLGTLIDDRQIHERV